MNLFEKIAKINWMLAPMAAFLGAAAWFQPAVAGSDLWWHLASGREIWTSAGIPTADVFSWTYAGREWMNHEWLWDLLYWLAYRIHPEAVAWLNLAVVSLVYLVAYAVGVRDGGSRLGSGAALWLVAASAHWFLDIRPHVTTLLLVGVFLLTRHQRRAVWLWPPLMAIWCNLHGGFVFGYGMIGLHVLVMTVRRSLAQRRLQIPWPEWLSVAGSTLAFLANPWGYRILEYPLAYLDSDSPFRGLIEWQPPAFELSLAYFEGRFWLVSLLAAIGAGLAVHRWIQLRNEPSGAESGEHGAARLDPFLILLALVCFQMAVTSRRFIPLFGVVSVPLIAYGVRRLRDLAAQRLPALDAPVAATAASIVGLAVAALLWTDVRIHPHLLTRWTEGNLYPEAGLRYLKALAPGKQLLNYYNWGGYIMLHAPEFKVFIDGRANTLYGEKIYLDYQAMLGGRPGMRARIAQYPADAAFVPAGIGRIGSELESLGWKVVYSDQLSTILLPPNSRRLLLPIPRPDVVLGDHPDFLLSRAIWRMGQKDFSAAETDLRQALAADPLSIRAWSGLIRLLAITGDTERLALEVERAIALQPRRRFHLRSVEGQALEIIGDLPNALRAYRDSIPAGPFAKRSRRLRQIEALEARLLSSSGS